MSLNCSKQKISALVLFGMMLDVVWQTFDPIVGWIIGFVSYCEFTCGLLDVNPFFSSTPVLCIYMIIHLRLAMSKAIGGLCFVE